MQLFADWRWKYLEPASPPSFRQRCFDVRSRDFFDFKYNKGNVMTYEMTLQFSAARSIPATSCGARYTLDLSAWFGSLTIMRVSPSRSIEPTLKSIFTSLLTTCIVVSSSLLP